MICLKSYLRDKMISFLEMRKASFSKSTYDHDKSIIQEFDVYLSENYCNEKALNEAIILGWIASLSGKTSSIANKVIFIRIFIKYLKGYGIDSFEPSIPKVLDDYVPYIFSDDELQKIFHYADNMVVSSTSSNQFIQYEMPMILRLMYGCGLRIGETISLCIRDIDFDLGALTMRVTKGNKQRMVPMHKDLNQMLKKYCVAMGVIGVSDARIFPKGYTDASITVKNAGYWFNKILLQSKIEKKQNTETDGLKERGPCLHCLRHVFVFKSFEQIESKGIRIDDAVPYLSIYLGHDSLKETEKYMKFSSEMFPDAAEMFGSFASEIFPEVTDHDA